MFAESFQKLYGRTPEFDASVVSLLRQREVVPGLDHPWTPKEIRSAVVGKLRDTGPGPSGLRAVVWKALCSTETGFLLVQRMALAFFETGEVTAEWETGLLSILPKKGDLSQAGNYRGIMMLEVAYKLIALLLLIRLETVHQSLGDENQCGFCPGRGTTDASFSLKQALRKRREHGLETWVLFTSTWSRLLIESRASCYGRCC